MEWICKQVQDTSSDNLFPLLGSHVDPDQGSCLLVGPWSLFPVQNLETLSELILAATEERLGELLPYILVLLNNL